MTGGGSAGHVTPNLALIEAITSEGGHVDYIGSKASVEEELIGKIGVPFYAISSGKLRRYFSWKNFWAPFSILCGIVQAYFLLSKLKTKLVFSKGGFVAFPVVVAAWLHRIPVIAHESDMTPGLANRLSFPFVNKICLNFDLAKQSFKKQSVVEVTGTPIRSALFGFDANTSCTSRGLYAYHFSDKISSSRSCARSCKKFRNIRATNTGEIASLAFENIYLTGGSDILAIKSFSLSSAFTAIFSILIIAFSITWTS